MEQNNLMEGLSEIKVTEVYETVDNNNLVAKVVVGTVVLAATTFGVVKLVKFIKNRKAAKQEANPTEEIQNENKKK